MKNESVYKGANAANPMIPWGDKVHFVKCKKKNWVLSNDMEIEWTHTEAGYQQCWQYSQPVLKQKYIYTNTFPPKLLLKKFSTFYMVQKCASLSPPKTELPSYQFDFFLW